MRAILLITLILFSFSSCNEPEEKKSDTPILTHPIDGSWIIRRGVGPYADRQIGQVFSFKGDRFQFNKGQLSFMGAVSYTENSFTITTDKNPTPKTFFYKIQGDTMILNMENSQLTFYLVKIITN